MCASSRGLEESSLLPAAQECFLSKPASAAVAEEILKGKQCRLRREDLYRKNFSPGFLCLLYRFSEPGRHGPVFFLSPDRSFHEIAITAPRRRRRCPRQRATFRFCPSSILWCRFRRSACRSHCLEMSRACNPSCRLWTHRPSRLSSSA